MEPFDLDFGAASAAIRERRLSPLELTDSCLRRLQAVEPRIGAFAHVSAERAREAARQAEQEIAAGRWRGPLHGIPIGVKDLFDTAGVPSTSSSRVRSGRVPQEDSAVIERLCAAGAILLGQTQTHEFAYGGVTPTTRNPWGLDRIPGGSSGGSAAAVAAGVCTIATGTDTAGSIRIPAALCGVVGLKPTYGRVSRRGITPLSWSLDHAGALTRGVYESALVLSAIAGFDPADPASVDLPVPDYTQGLEQGIAGLRIGLAANHYFDHVSEEVEAAVRAAVALLARLGATVRPVTIPMPGQILGTEWAILMPEASAYHQQSLRRWAELYEPDVRAQLEAGELILATDYIKALRVRGLMRQAWNALYDEVDVVVTPTMAAVAYRVGEEQTRWPDGTVESNVLMLVRLTCQSNLTGLPALSLPVGFDQNGLPIAMQLIGRAFDEQTLLRLARAYERASDTVGRVAPV